MAQLRHYQTCPNHGPDFALLHLRCDTLQEEDVVKESKASVPHTRGLCLYTITQLPWHAVSGLPGTRPLMPPLLSEGGCSSKLAFEVRLHTKL